MNIQRFQEDFCAIAQFGVLNNGGVTRLAFTKEDMDARNYLIEVMRSARLQVTIDPVGNIRGLRVGRNPKLSSVMIGSHLDTVPHGGHYDGVVGVLAALETVRSLNDADIETERSIEVVNFSAEESSRFGMATIGSKAMTGKLKVSQLRTLTDDSGENLYQILKKSGHNVDEMPQAVVTSDNIYAYLELHIEQGPVLENEQRNVGIVSAIAAPSRFNVHIKGRSDHSGNTPMTMRRDALAGAAEIVLGVETIALHGGANTVGTVGALTVRHGAMNIVPGSVDLSIDIRDTNLEDKSKAVDNLNLLLTEIADRRKLDIQTTILCNDTPVQLSKKIAQQLCQHAQQLQLNCKTMPSGAGHDAMHFTSIAPTGLIFIPSINGVSHSIEEKSSLEDICNGVKLLHKTALTLANDVP
ncbi:MAG: M20 family metallo-hydrolase [Thermodesulfobacteriota bacterium]|nr:M20 family metallo-hydrolase [Thermodesulfobacteriota bacterium]